MSIKALHFPHDHTAPITEVTVDEKNAMNYYRYVQGGPVEGGYLNLGGLDVVCYVNSRYAALPEDLVNERATALFEVAGVGMYGGAIRGDSLLVRGAGPNGYERSLPADFAAFFLDTAHSEI
ncbi:hypothetical protein [Isoptericola sp. NPDC019482]|uniref:hypothetical protein n=1 Tax=Isoptericola sp. NPDC019482 TaxID=3154688 RepID=UPI00347F1A53